MKQTRVVSLIEALLNVASGFVVALVLWQFLAWVYDIHMPISRNLEITSIFTVVSVARSYIWRRLFNNGAHLATVRVVSRLYRRGDNAITK